MFDDIEAEPIEPHDEEPEHYSRPAPCKPVPVDQLREIIDRHRADFDKRTYDYGPLRDNRRLVRGSAEHAAAYGKRQPQWFAHLVGITTKGRRISFLDAMRSEARERFGPGAAEQIEPLL